MGKGSAEQALSFYSKGSVLKFFDPPLWIIP